MVGFKGRSSQKQYVPKNPLSEVLKCGVGAIVGMGILVPIRFMLGNGKVPQREIRVLG